MSETVISLNAVTKRFGPVVAVDGVTLDIARGEFFSLLGPSGCGKTTLLRLLAGLEFPSSGEIIIDGKRMDGTPANLRPTNMVFQNYAIFPHMNVFENIGYGLRRLKLPRQELQSRIEAALAMVKLEGFGPRTATQLSGGQRQRVALARALVCRPQVLLLDEPLGALDRELRSQMQLELRELQNAVGITFVNVTHDQGEALSLSDRIAILARGQLLQVGAPSQLYDAPASREVARFLGHTNFLDGKVREATVTGIAVDAGALGTLLGPPVAGARPGMLVTLAVRPENMSIGANPAHENHVPGCANGRTYLGDRTLFHFKVPGLAEPVTVSASSGETYSGHSGEGSEIRLSWPAKASVILTC